MARVIRPATERGDAGTRGNRIQLDPRRAVGCNMDAVLQTAQDVAGAIPAGSADTAEKTQVYANAIIARA